MHSLVLITISELTAREQGTIAWAKTRLKIQRDASITKTTGHSHERTLALQSTATNPWFTEFSVDCRICSETEPESIPAHFNFL